MKKWITIALIFLLLFLGYNYLYKDHRDIQNENPEFILTADEISQKFFDSSEFATSQFLNKAIIVSGVITDINDTDITLNNSIFCNFNNMIQTDIQVSDVIKIKGRCIGYDDLLEQIKLDQCNLIH